MKAALLRELGGPPVYADFDEPVAGEGQVVVEMAAAAIHHVDLARASGTFYLGPPPLPSVLGSDGVSDVMPGPDPAWPIAIHMCAIVGMGIHLLDNLRLDLLADACAKRGRWEFLFVVAPLQIGGAESDRVPLG